MSEVPACGFGFGVCVVVELLKDKGILPSLPKSVDFVVAAFNENMQGAAMRATRLMRGRGANVDLLLEPKKKMANSSTTPRDPRFIAFAPSEWERRGAHQGPEAGRGRPGRGEAARVKVEDLGDVRGALRRWADAKAMKNLKL